MMPRTAVPFAPLGGVLLLCATLLGCAARPPMFAWPADAGAEGLWSVTLRADAIGSARAIVILRREHGGMTAISAGAGRPANLVIRVDARRGSVALADRSGTITHSALVDGSWRLSFEGDLQGSLVAVPYQGRVPSRDADSLLQRFDGIVSRFLFDPRELDTDAWRAFRQAFGDGARSAGDDLDLLLAFQRARDAAGLFSHFELRPSGATVAALAARADSNLAFAPVVQLDEPVNGVAVLVLRSFFGAALLAEIDSALDRVISAGAHALIIDLRGNPGGTFAAWPVLARLAREPARVGALVAGRWFAEHPNAPTVAEMQAATPMSVPDPQALAADLMSDGLLVLSVVPQAPTFTGRVLMLIDGGTASTSEIVAAALQRMGRATIVGQRSAGEVLNAELFPLGEDLSLLLPLADFRLPDGVRLEGRGVRPDVQSPAGDALACAQRLLSGASSCNDGR